MGKLRLEWRERIYYRRWSQQYNYPIIDSFCGCLPINVSLCESQISCYSPSTSQDKKFLEFSQTDADQFKNSDLADMA